MSAFACPHHFKLLGHTAGVGNAFLAAATVTQSRPLAGFACPCMQTEALQSPWTPRQRAVLSSEEGAESVVEAVARVDRLSEVRTRSTTVSL